MAAYIQIVVPMASISFSKIYVCFEKPKRYNSRCEYILWNHVAMAQAKISSGVESGYDKKHSNKTMFTALS